MFFNTYTIIHCVYIYTYMYIRDLHHQPEIISLATSMAAASPSDPRTSLSVARRSESGSPAGGQS